MKKSILVIMCIISVCLTIILIVSTFARYEEEANAKLEFGVGNWSIKLNNTDITQNNTYDFLIDDIKISGHENVVSGKIAPGFTGYFDINIDATDTDVSVKYELNIDSEIFENSKIQVVKVSEVSENNLIQTGQYSYTGVILLDDVKQGKQHTLRIEIEWLSDDEENEEDYEFANKMDNMFKIPISVNVKQYIGEEIKAYN